MIGVFDTETDSPDPTDARIISAFVGLLDDDGQLISAEEYLLQPDRPIPAEATAIHGITTEHAQRHGIPRRRALVDILRELEHMQIVGNGSAAFNAVYDFTVLDREVRREQYPAPMMEPRPIIDPFVIDKAHDTYRPGKRTLQAVCHQYGIPFNADDAHGAEYDAVAAGRLALELLKLPRIVDSVPDGGNARELVHRWSIVWKRRQSESFREYRRSRGEDISGIRDEWPVLP